MSPPKDVTAQAGVGSKLKVFVSYSRNDATFADELVSGLELCGFEAYLDKADIAPGEPWEARLGRLIRDADTVVYVLSPSSIASEHCAWEVAETERLSKRLMPIVWRAVPDNEVPGQLRRLNYIFFTEGHSLTKSLGELANALRTDLDWIRQHTRFAELADNWDERGRPASLLLLGGEIDDAKAWLVKRPKDAPQITIQQQAFIDASIESAEEAKKRDAALHWRAKAGTIAAAIIFAIGTAVATALLLRTISASNELAAKLEQLKSANLELRAANLRLSRKIALRVAPSGDASYFVKSSWYQIASDYSAAIAMVTINSNKGTFIGSGFILRGSALYAPWGTETVFVTASYLINSNEPGHRPEEAQASFPGLEEENPPIKFGKILWESAFDSANPQKGHDVTVLRIKEPLPFGAKPIERVRVQEFEDLPDFDPSKSDTRKTFSRPMAIIGYGGMAEPGEEQAGFALFLNNLIGVVNRDPEGKPLNLGYTEAAQPGAGGSPVFDVDTGELVAVHHLGMSKNKVGVGVSIVSVIAAIRKDLGPQR